MKRAALLLLLLLPFTPLAEAAGPKGWWDRKWECRKRISLVQRQRWKDAPSARFRFGTGGRARDDGADIRVVTVSGKEVPRKVLARGPGDLVEIVFPIRGLREWFVYHGNPDAKPPAESFEPDRGLTLVTRARGAGNPANWPAMKKILERSVQVFGGASWKRVFDAENPFGRSDNYVSEYRGFIMAPKAGRYTFYTASDEASFLFVKGKLVAQWPGWHGAGRGAWGHYKGQIDLERGLYPFRYVHVERTGGQVMAAYWLLPGAKRAAVITEAFFPGHQEVAVLYHEARDGGPAADFAATPSDKWGLDNRVFTGVRFQARPTGSKPTYHWDFGDGVTAEGAEVYHVYMKGGEFDVHLTVRGDGEEDSIIRTIRVRGEWTRFDRNHDGVLKRMAASAASYPAGRMSPPDIVQLVFLLDQAGRDADNIRILRSVLRTSKQITKAEAFRFAMDLGRRYVDGPGILPAAEWAFRKALSAGTKKQELLARLGLADAMVRLGGDMKAARLMLEGIAASKGGKKGKTGRHVWLRLGDARMLVGNGAGARIAYEKAEEIAGGPENARRLLRKAAAARAAMTHIEAGRGHEAMRYLKEWEEEAPTDRYTGLHRIALAKAWIAQTRPENAMRELKALVKSNPESEYADQALYLMAGIEEGRGNAAAASALRERLSKDYPWSPLNPK